MFEAGEGVGHVFGHVELNCSLFVVPLELYAAEEVAIPVRDGLVVLLYDYVWDKLHIYYTKKC